MSVLTMLAKVRTEHLPHAGDPGAVCDACRLLELVDKHRLAMQTLQERVSKGQYSQEDFSAILRDGLGR